MWHHVETEMWHKKLTEIERSNQKSHVHRRCLRDSCRPTMHVINAGARDREDFDFKYQDMGWYIVVEFLFKMFSLVASR